MKVVTKKTTDFKLRSQVNYSVKPIPFWLNYICVTKNITLQGVVYHCYRKLPGVLNKYLKDGILTSIVIISIMTLIV